MRQLILAAALVAPSVLAQGAPTSPTLMAVIHSTGMWQAATPVATAAPTERAWTIPHTVLSGEPGTFRLRSAARAAGQPVYRIEVAYEGGSANSQEGGTQVGQVFAKVITRCLGMTLVQAGQMGYWMVDVASRATGNSIEARQAFGKVEVELRVVEGTGGTYISSLVATHSGTPEGENTCSL